MSVCNIRTPVRPPPSLCLASVSATGRFCSKESQHEKWNKSWAEQGVQDETSNDQVWWAVDLWDWEARWDIASYHPCAWKVCSVIGGEVCRNLWDGANLWYNNQSCMLALCYLNRMMTVWPTHFRMSEGTYIFVMQQHLNLYMVLNLIVHWSTKYWLMICIIFCNL